MTPQFVAWSGADFDAAVRAAAFQFLDEQTTACGEESLSRAFLQRGFDFRGERVPLIGPQGIFKPRVLPEMPLSITTAPRGPYSDEVGPDGLLRYRYRGADPLHRDNVGLRLAMRRGVPLVYLYGIDPGRYLAVWPTYVVRDDPGALTFTVAVDTPELAFFPPQSEGPAVVGRERIDSNAESPTDPGTEARRRYITIETVRRLHQRSFSERVLRAYAECCAICRLRHRELLEAAHILPDGHPRGEPVVPNGIALCRLHHTAYDRHILGISPDLRIEIRRTVLEEKDGPMLIHGLQGFQGASMSVPRAPRLQPNREFLAERYAMFREAG